MLPLVQHMRSLASAGSVAGVISVEEVTLRQQIGEAVLTASLDLDGVLGEVDYERAAILELREQLSGKRDHKVDVLTRVSLNCVVCIRRMSGLTSTWHRPRTRGCMCHGRPS